MKTKYSKSNLSNNILISSLKESFLLISKNKRKIFVLLILQILLLSTLLGLQMFYQSKSFFAAQEVVSYLNSQDLSEENVAANAFGANLLGDDPLLVYRNYKEIAGFMVALMLFSFFAYLLFGSFIWGIIDRFVSKSSKKNGLFSYVGKFCVVSSFYLVVISIFAFLGVKGIVVSYASDTPFNLFNIIFFFLSLLLIYFMFISFSLISKVKLKDIFKKSLSIGRNHFANVSFVYLINLAVIALSVFITHLLSEGNMFLLFLGMIFAVFSFVWTRLFLMVAFDKLYSKN